MSGRRPAYERRQRTIAPLSDGRTPGVCSHCGKQHAPAPASWDPPSGCYDPESVFVPPPNSKNLTGKREQ